MKRIFIAFLAALFLSGCFGGGTPINDFSTRSTFYGWVDVSGIHGNHLYEVAMRQYSPQTDTPFYSMAVKKMDGGYLFWHHGGNPGAVEFDRMMLQTCAVIICGNTINEYTFDAYGDSPGKTRIGAPGVYFVGRYEMTKIRTGLFRAGAFDMTKTNKGPSQRAMLAELLSTTPEGHPVVDQRIRNAMGR
jgi:hypothetical protein